MVDAGKSLVAVVFDFLLGVAVKVIPDLATLHRTRTVRSPPAARCIRK
jgi:hypothetical protein